MPGRMAYLVNLENDKYSSDIPTTLIRSKVEVPEPLATLSTSNNDLVINKLTQILSYLRQGLRPKKSQKKVENYFKIFF